MATAIRSGLISESPGEPCAWPAFESMQESAREARRAVAAARHAADDLAADAVARVRSHPLRATGIAVLTGAVLGSFLGFGVGWFARNRT